MLKSKVLRGAIALVAVVLGTALAGCSNCNTCETSCNTCETACNTCEPACNTCETSCNTCEPTCAPACPRPCPTPVAQVSGQCGPLPPEAKCGEAWCCVMLPPQYEDYSVQVCTCPASCREECIPAVYADR